MDHVKFDKLKLELDNLKQQRRNCSFSEMMKLDKQISEITTKIKQVVDDTK